MHELLISIVAAIAGVLLQRYKVIPLPAPSGPTPPAPPAPDAPPAPAPAPSAHPVLDAILARVLALVLRQKAGAALTAPEQVELRTALPVAQQLLNEAAVGAASPPPSR